MTNTPIPACRHLLLLGTALAVSASAFTGAAEAQSLNPSQLTVSGSTVSMSDQTSVGADVFATSLDPYVDALGDANAASIEVIGKSVSAAASANVAATALDTVQTAASALSTNLSASMTGVVGSAPVLVAVRQASEDSSVTSRITGGLSKAQIGAMLGNVTASSISVADSALSAKSIGNDAASSVTMSASGIAPGAGIVTDQSINLASPVFADENGFVRMLANTVTGSDLAITGNTETAIARGNSASSALVVSTGSAASQSGPYPAATADPARASASVNAPFAVLSDQRVSGPINAQTVGGYDIQTSGAASGSSLAIEGNPLLASATGNRSAGSLSLETSALAAGPLPGGAIANVTNVQKAASNYIGALTDGVPKISVGANLTDASLTVSGNSVTALAAANVAEANDLRVSGASLVASTVMPGSGGDLPGGGGLPPRPPVGTALVDMSGMMTASAPISVQNGQVSSAMVEANANNAMAQVAIAGRATGSSINATGNRTLAAATGNSSASSLELDGSAIGVAADLNNLQAGTGWVSARAGNAAMPAGVSISTGGGTSGSTLRVADNVIEASTGDNSARNALTATSATFTNTSGHSNASSGLMSGGAGAAADFALANAQYAASGSESGFDLAANAEGRFAISSNGAPSTSLLDVSGNSQTASVRANGATNQLALQGSKFGGDAGMAPGSALSNTQVADVRAAAQSQLVLEVPGNPAGSQSSITGNSNSASAQLNAAANELSVEGATVGKLTGLITLQAGTNGPVNIMGDHVLASRQLADGLVEAASTTNLVLSGPGAFTGSALNIEGNRTEASVRANDVSNQISLASGDGGAAAGLLNVQESSASAVARASSEMADYNTSGAAARMALSGNDVAAEARGNNALNGISLSGSASGSALVQWDSGNLAVTRAPALLANDQRNAGAVLAEATNSSARTGFYGELNGTMIDLASNSLTAAAYGNSAANSVAPAFAAGVMSAALVTNRQVNSGAVSAYTVNPGQVVAPSILSSSRVTMTGETASATAIGNYAASSIGRSH